MNHTTENAKKKDFKKKKYQKKHTRVAFYISGLEN